MTTRSLFVLVGFYSLCLAGALVWLNASWAGRRAMRGEGTSPIPGLVTVLGLTALRTLALTLYRPWIFTWWTIGLTVLADVASWLAPPMVVQWLDLSDSEIPADAPAPTAAPAPGAPPPASEAGPALTLRPRPPGVPSPFAKRPPTRPREPGG